MLHEAVLALAGYPGDFFSENGSWAEFFKRMHPCERALVSRISVIASYYGRLKGLIEHHTRPDLRCSLISCFSIPSGGQGAYLTEFFRGLDEVLEPYRDDLQQLEKDCLTGQCTTLSQVAVHAEKYSHLFINLDRLVKLLTHQNLYGCQILGFLHRQLSYGEGDVKEAIQQIFNKCSIIFYKQLSGWILFGDLMDDYKEFFIQPLRTSHMEVSKYGGNLYTSFYNFGIFFKMLPLYIPAAVVYKILFIGQIILMAVQNAEEKNKITGEQSQSVSLLDREEEEDFIRKLQELLQLPQFPIDKFQETVNEIHTCVTEHLWQVAREKVEVSKQLKLIRESYLLGHGELFHVFIQLLSPIMTRKSPPPTDKEVNQAFHLAACMVLPIDETALEKLNFLIQSKDKTQSEIPNWKCLTLNYKVSWPLHMLFTPEVLSYYNKLFQFLLRVKMLQANLHSLWINLLKCHRAKQKFNMHPTMRQLHTGLMLVVDHLLYYLQVDVLERRYMHMVNKIQNAQDFGNVQQAHAIFQSHILSQSFLRVVNTSTETPRIQVKVMKQHPVYNCLQEILHLGEFYCSKIKMWLEPLDFIQSRLWDPIYERLTTEVLYLMQIPCSLYSEPFGDDFRKFQLSLDFYYWRSQSPSVELPHPPTGTSSVAAESQPSTSTG